MEPNEVKQTISKSRLQPLVNSAFKLGDTVYDDNKEVLFNLYIAKDFNTALKFAYDLQRDIDRWKSVLDQLSVELQKVLLQSKLSATSEPKYVHLNVLESLKMFAKEFYYINKSIEKLFASNEFSENYLYGVHEAATEAILRVNNIINGLRILSMKINQYISKMELFLTKEKNND